ncbi:polysaccharide lyase [uncultured Aquimarina sp.]|uniref:polysaccharide lyase n=1 Tax=uncultured Aquimarina sp. TaxID=575652 RepID=UPI002606480F|nr:carboxypeptidase regulatory-like domain-containing protein [uncultured Aquimarina sp.]
MKNHLLYSLLLLITVTTVKAQISGTVKDQSGNPIENALVCDANNVTNYAKTDENGIFDLTTGDNSTQLRIGALKYETVKSTSQRNIILAPDPLLENDEYHISFDHLRVGDTYTENELKEDFPTSNGIGFYDGQTINGQKDNTQDRASIDYENSIDPGGVSLKVKYPKGLLKTNSSGIDTRIPLMNTFKDNYYESSDLYLSYWIKFSDDFDFNLCGGKLPSLGGSDPNTPDGERDSNRWKGRIMFRKGGAIQFYMELPGEQEPADDATNEDENELRFWGDRVVDGTNICSFEYENYLRAQGWHNIELHYVLESTPNGNDGLFEGWVDGVNYDFVGSNYFNYYRNPSENRENITINHILISTFLGGSDVDDYAPKDTDYYVWFDEFRVSEQRINEWDFYTNTLSVEEYNEISNIKIFPNPSSGSYNLTKKTDWIVYDLSGKEITNGIGKTVDLTGYPKGVYFLKTEISDVTLKLILK